ncbi:MAG: hypothetical protein Q4B77_05830 [Coriobacteriaceae bacterium]|nr:hypothetical protein [Coriobacteriaceae bacterium]
MLTLLDTNAALRYLLEDIQEQADVVADAVLNGAEITIEVLAECVYVLEGVYHVSRSDIAESLGCLLDEVTCRRKQVAATALGYYSGSTFDFVDCILAAERDLEERVVLTFDKKLSKLLTSIDSV